MEIATCDICDGGKHGTLLQCSLCESWFGDQCLIKIFIHNFIFKSNGPQLKCHCPTFGCDQDFQMGTWPDLFEFFNVFKHKPDKQLRNVSRYFWNIVNNKDRDFFNSLNPILGADIVSNRQAASSVGEFIHWVEIARAEWVNRTANRQPVSMRVYGASSMYHHQ